jgi:predicted metal-dependent phosphoesterase TrpH
MRADLHVHTRYSTVNRTLPFLRSRDCYSRPIDVYRTAKSRGMDLVAITDHDSIDGALELLQHVPDAPDIIVGEEVSCWFPDGGIEVHLGAYGMTEALHRDVQSVRKNVFEVAALLHSAGVFFSLNHLFHFYRGQTSFANYLRLLDVVPALEVRNGAMLQSHNELIERIVGEYASSRGSRFAVVAGSDAHTLRRVGRTWTEAPGRDRAEFLESLWRGLGRPRGNHGGVTVIAGDVYGVIGRYAASLVGWGPRDHRGWHRGACVAAVVASIPVQFFPFAVAAVGKLAEYRQTSRARQNLHDETDRYAWGATEKRT